MGRMARMMATLAAAALAVSIGGSAQAATAAPSKGTAGKGCVRQDARTLANVRMRAAPSTRSASLRVLPGGYWVAMPPRDRRAEQRGWIKVHAYGQSGYVSKSYAEGPWLAQRACNTLPNPRPIPAKFLNRIKKL